MKLKLASLGLLMTLVAGYGLAQAPTKRIPDQDPSGTPLESEAPAETSPTAAEPELAADPVPNSDPEAASEDSPFDYQASEQISEDLSVSFPVDI